VLVGSGDDAAVIAAGDGRYVVSTDMLVEGRHFRLDWSTGFDVGWRAAMQNLADMAAMGAQPTALVVALGMPGTTAVAWVEDFTCGLAAACSTCGAVVVGGDLSGADSVIVSVTVHGDLEGRAPVLRSGARPGDVVAHAGTLGHSAAGLAALQYPSVEQGSTAARPLKPSDVALSDRQAFIDAYLRPNPPLASGPAAALAGATAMLDVSDGLLRDAARIAAASSVTIDLSSAAITRHEQQAPLGLALTGGEDHGLLATFPPYATLPPGFTPIGHVTEGTPTVTLDGQTPATSPGWDHFNA
jgi:thiamine-monophosphate kinase